MKMRRNRQKKICFQKSAISGRGHHRRHDMPAAPVAPHRIPITARCRQQQAKRSHWTQPCINSAICNPSAVRVQSECSVCAVEVQSVYSRSAVKVQLDCSRFAVHLQSSCSPRTLFHSCSSSPSSSANSLIALLLYRWCVLLFRSVLMSVFHALAWERYKGPRDTTPGLCRCFAACLPDTALAAEASPAGVQPSLKSYPTTHGLRQGGAVPDAHRRAGTNRIARFLTM